MKVNRHIFQFWLSRVIGSILFMIAGFVLQITFPALKDMPIAFLVILSGMLLLEYLRGGSYHTLGIPFDTTTFLDILYGIIFGIVPIALFLLILGALSKIDISLGSFDSAGGIFSIVIVASLEELMFRGVLFQACVDRFSFIPVAFVFSMLFSLAHLTNPSFDEVSMLNTFLAGLLFSYAWYHTRALWLPIALHVSWNLSLYVTGLVLSGIEIHDSLFLVTISEDVPIPWLNSTYGIEGTVYCTIILITMIYGISKVHVEPKRMARLFRMQYNIQ